ncbi:hypothetical protein SAMN05216249_12817 [Acetitomaculum ruminis DSM 5522]|uniref:Uncharacterized protein n=1 Tax=Acetitomaculum ruminis DSM 5522 TaxID=1120918 RepID=A0A1I1AIA2_9FIRM|nr:hypothetical protein [Acetitomaculum ruminis]SFB37755.1 hypothetical protein SAMN05216249_12817 [Acetitomaculum ruminis DSM 5522]
MKTKIIYAVGICMVAFIIFFTVKTSGILKKNNAFANKENKKTVSEDETNTKELSKLEKTMLKESKTERICYINEKGYSCGRVVKVKSYEIKEGFYDVAEIQGYKERYEDYFKEDHSEKSTIIIDIEVTNKNVREYREADADDEENNVLCLGDILLVIMDKKGKIKDEEELFLCTNDENDPIGKSGWMCTLKEGETYKGKLVYVVHKDVLKDSTLGLDAHFSDSPAPDIPIGLYIVLEDRKKD